MPNLPAAIRALVVDAVLGKGDYAREATLGKLEPAGVAVNYTLRANAEEWLDRLRGEVRPTSFTEVKAFLTSLYGLPFLGPTFDVSKIDEALVQQVHKAIRGQAGAQATKKKRWGFWRRFVRYCWSCRRLGELPRNLHGFAFDVSPTRVKRYPLSLVREVLAKLDDRHKLVALLGLNCGMTNVDTGTLTKDAVDLANGTLTRKRVKTADYADVPTVTYKLWPETLALLRKLWSDHPTLVLTSIRGTPLWASEYQEGKEHKKDLISKEWRKLKLPIPAKAFRSIAATLIESNREYGSRVVYFLGHSPRTIRDRHYVAYDQALFDELLDWLRGQVFTTPE
jgi:hypothetical protein